MIYISKANNPFVDNSPWLSSTGLFIDEFLFVSNKGLE